MDNEKVNNLNVPQVISSNNNAKKKSQDLFYQSAKFKKYLRKTENIVSVTL